MNISEIVAAVKADGADVESILTTALDDYAEEQKGGVLSKNSELIQKNKQLKADLEKKDGEYQALIGKTDDAKSDLERSFNTLKSDFEGLQADLKQKDQAIKESKITRELQNAMTRANVRAESVNDFLAVAKSDFSIDDAGRVVTPDGADPDKWVADNKVKRPYFWPESRGAGASGGNGAGAMGDNPWLNGNWNMTAQAQFLKEHGKDKAEQAAKAAGSTVGSIHPPAK